jgi:chromate reductase
VKAADAVLFVTPEYNRSIPAPLKNALDVGSRPMGQSVWAGKPGAVVSASPSPIGAFGANQHLRQSLAALDVRTMAQPDMYLGHADKLFDARGLLLDESARVLMRLFLHAFEDWVDLIAPR